MASRILVVDDEPRWLRVMSLYLESRRYQVRTAQSGDEALRKIGEMPPDLVIADISMPGMDGYELCNRLRRDPRTRAIPFIFFTGRDQNQDRGAAARIGADTHLTKPCPLEQVAQRIEAAMDRLEQARALPSTRIGPSGCLESLDLPDLVQTLELEQYTGALLLSRRDRTGTLYFRDGVIVQIDSRSHRAEPPLTALLGWKTGRFMLLAGAQPDHRADTQPIEATVADVLVRDWRTLEAIERQSAHGHPAEPAPRDRRSAADPAGEVLARIEAVGQRLFSLHPQAVPPQIVRVLVVGMGEPRTGQVLQCLVEDLAEPQGPATDTAEPWAAYRTEVGRVRISPHVALHLMAVRAEKRFWPIWERILPHAQGALLLVPATGDAGGHGQAFLKARDTLAPALPIVELSILAQAAAAAGPPDSSSLRLQALGNALRQWLEVH